MKPILPFSLIGVMCLSSIAAQAAKPASTSVPVTTAVITTANVLPATIPYTLTNGLLTVKVTVTGLTEMDAVINTGLALSLIAPEYAALNGGFGEGSVNVNLWDETVSASKAKPQTIKIGNVELKDVPFGVYNVIGHISASPSPESPKLWLGASALGAFKVTIDPVRHVLVLDKPGGSMPKDATVWTCDLQDNRLWVAAKANGRGPFPVLVETAIAGVMIPYETGKAINVKPIATADVSTPGGDTTKATLVRLKDLWVGGLTIKDIQAIFVNPTDATLTGKRQGIIGTDVLMRYRSTIDYTQRLVALEDLTPAGPEHHRNGNPPNGQDGQNRPPMGGYGGNTGIRFPQR